MNKKNCGATTNGFQMIVDILCYVMIFVFACIAYDVFSSKELDLYGAISFSTLYVLIYILQAKNSKIYDLTTFMYNDRVLKIITKSFLIAVISTSTAMYFFGGFNRLFFIIFYGTSYIGQIVSTFVLGAVASKSQVSPLNVLFVGRDEECEKLLYYFSKTRMSINKVASMSIEEFTANCTNSESGVENALHKYAVDSVYFCRGEKDEEAAKHCLDICRKRGIIVNVVITPYLHDCPSYVSSVGTFPVITYHIISLNWFSQMLKRTMDIIASIIGIIIFAPVMLITAVLIKLDSPGPVLFRQTRIGKNGRNFKIYKFRTMYIDAEQRKKELIANNEYSDTLLFKIKNDPRITKIGSFLRKSSIDELPQFFNVLKGDMSLVGTRPPTVDEVNQYNNEQYGRLSIKPGITGLWQVSGRNHITAFSDVLRLDLQYIMHWSVVLDLKIILKTFFVVFNRNGAY